MKFFLVLFLGIFPLLATWAIADSKFLQKVQEGHDRVQGFSADFVQESFDNALERKSTARGKLDFLKPGLMKWDYKEIYKESGKKKTWESYLQLIVVGKDTVWIFDPDLNNVTLQKLANVSGITSLSFLTGKGKLQDEFKINPERSESYLDADSDLISLFLVPVKNDPSFAELQLGIDPKTYRIQQTVVVDRKNNYRKITFNNLRLNEKLKPEEFVFKIEDGMEVISSETE